MDPSGWLSLFWQGLCHTLQLRLSHCKQANQPGRKSSELVAYRVFLAIYLGTEIQARRIKDVEWVQTYRALMRVS
jgi:hypothetical protein